MDCWKIHYLVLFSYINLGWFSESESPKSVTRVLNCHLWLPKGTKKKRFNSMMTWHGEHFCSGPLLHRRRNGIDTPWWKRDGWWDVRSRRYRYRMGVRLVARYPMAIKHGNWKSSSSMVFFSGKIIEVNGGFSRFQAMFDYQMLNDSHL